MLKVMRGLGSASSPSPHSATALEPHQPQRRVVAPLVGDREPTWIDQKPRAEQQLLEVLKSPVGDQDRSPAHGVVVSTQRKLDTRPLRPV